MAVKEQKAAVLKQLKRTADPLSLPEILSKLPEPVPERTLRRWLVAWVDDGVLVRSGQKRGTRYAYVRKHFELGFLQGLQPAAQQTLLKQLRDLWSHNSTSLEGNTLTLGDTHFVLEQGLTISGKPLKDHQEVVGHASALELLYQSLAEPVSESLIFELHRAVQTERVSDIYKPNGAWKAEPNGTYVVTREGKQEFIEYAEPWDVPKLMAEVIAEINSENTELSVQNAAAVYAKIHMGIAHIHPFWDGNGRISRLLANVPLLKAGLPPIIIPTDKRRDYIQSLAEYQLEVGQLTATAGVWPSVALLDDFTKLCGSCYSVTADLLSKFKQE